MLFQNKSFHGRRAEEKAALAEVTSAACGGFSRPQEAETFSLLVPADGEGNKERSLFIAAFRNAQVVFLELRGFYMYPPRSSSALGFISWKGASGTRAACSRTDGHIPPLSKLPVAMRQNTPSPTSKFGSLWVLRDGNPEESPSY